MSELLLSFRQQCLTELESGNAKTKVSREFKFEAVGLVKDRGVAVAQAARDLDLHENVLRKWVRDLSGDPQHTI
jgi:transposase